MRVVEVFKALILIDVTWRSISSSGWEYFDIERGLGFKSYVCQIVCYLIIIILTICLIMLIDNIIIELY